jgi:hypothetical protein
MVLMDRWTRIGVVGLGLAALVVSPVLAQDEQGAYAEGPDAYAIIDEALGAGPESIAAGAAVVDWEGNTLKEGTNGWTCKPSPPGSEEAPVCLDETWMAWAQAWGAKTDVTVDKVGIAYMLKGGDGGSNIDPYAEGPTEDNDWVEAGPHLMVIVPDATAYDALSTDYTTGEPWVMWARTPYPHIMIPLGDVE